MSDPFSIDVPSSLLSPPFFGTFLLLVLELCWGPIDRRFNSLDEGCVTSFMYEDICSSRGLRSFSLAISKSSSL
ncbi:hypothetical protein DSO57_1028884 [Entomophthora muscae]|uniref:Uncharacterized protein n=1 Tax=Entomophthora muscae TaxID=34485 RepID=A0ACC2RS96_9FUNG|nr:hypothetical protein DSO57_1028884 [Entomophthora muscae]